MIKNIYLKWIFCLILLPAGFFIKNAYTPSHKKSFSRILPKKSFSRILPSGIVYNHFIKSLPPIKGAISGVALFPSELDLDLLEKKIAQEKKDLALKEEERRSLEEAKEKARDEAVRIEREADALRREHTAEKYRRERTSQKYNLYAAIYDNLSLDDIDAIRRKLNGNLIRDAINIRDSIILESSLYKIFSERPNVGDTILHFLKKAITSGRIEREKGYKVFDRLILGGADINAVNKNGESVLHQAILDKDIGLIDFLLDKWGININLKTFYGDTPLHLAFRVDSPNIIKKLIELGADINIRDKNGLKLLDLLNDRSYGNRVYSEEIKRLLLKKIKNR